MENKYKDHPIPINQFLWTNFCFFAAVFALQIITLALVFVLLIRGKSMEDDVNSFVALKNEISADIQSIENYLEKIFRENTQCM